MPTRYPRRVSAGVGATVKVVTSVTRVVAAPGVTSVVAKAVVVAGRVAVVKGAIVAAQGRRAGMMEGARRAARLLKD